MTRIADTVLGKIDAVELRYQGGFDALILRDWYKYLNCGYRLPAVGGTDKMSATRVTGGPRTCADLRDEPFSLDAWMRAVRAGRMFSSTGALLLLRADGHAPGDEIAIAPRGATVEVEADPQSFAPLHHLEIVVNGRVVARADDRSGSNTLRLRERVHIAGPSWLAARCSAASETRASAGWPYVVAAHTSPIYFIRRGETHYVEKPGSHNVWEGRKVVEAANKYKRIVQHGVQLRSSEALREAVQMLRKGVIGNAYMARGLVFRWRPSIGKKPNEPVPSHINYDL